MLSGVLKLRQLGSKLVISEPTRPVVKTSIPGPQSISLLNQYQGMSQDFRTVKFFVDYESSFGNYLADADGNYLLDTTGQDGTIPLGYNNQSFLSALSSSNYMSNVMHRVSCHTMPGENWPHLIEKTLLPIAPAGLTEVFNSCGCSSGSTENALKSASIWFYKNKYGQNYTSEQLSSALKAKPPGTPNFAFVRLVNSHHSNLIGLGKETLYNPKLNTFWAPFPSRNYPEPNLSEESKALEATKKLFKENPNICAMIIEPIQSKGTYYATGKYYQELAKIVKESGAALIVDESFTGYGGTGKVWAYEHWDISPDILVYGGRTQISGYFMKPEFRPPQAYQISNTWCGDPLRLDQFKAIRAVAETQDLLAKVKNVGDYFFSQLANVLYKKEQVANLRGLGLHIAFDFKDKEKAWKFVADMLARGVYVNVVNDKTVQLSPPLVFDKQHADVFVQTTESCI